MSDVTHDALAGIYEGEEGADLSDRELSDLRDIIEHAAKQVTYRPLPTGQKLGVAGLALTLLLNMGALVWGAATLSTTVRHLGVQVERTAASLNRTTAQLNDIEARVRVLEAIP